MPGSGFAQTFIGMDVVVVLFLIAQGPAARPQVGRPVHHLHRRDRRRRHAPPGAPGPGRRRLLDRARVLPRLLLLRPQRRPDADRRPGARDPRVARASSSPRAPSAPRPMYPPAIQRISDSVRGYFFPGGMGGRGGGMALNQLLIQMDGVDEPPFMKQGLHQPPEHVPGRHLHRPPQGRQGCPCACARPSRAASRSTSSAPPTCRSTCSTRRWCAPAAWAATSGSARRPRTTARTSSSSTWARSTTTRRSTPTAAATSSRA